MPDEYDSWVRRVYSGVLVVVWIVAPYCLLQQVAIRGVWWIEPSGFDEIVEINFYALWVYFSYFLLLGWVGLSLEKPLYLRFLVSVGWVALVSHMVFLFVPSGVSREVSGLEEGPMIYRWLVGVDLPRNAFPSLHASLSVLAGLGGMCSKRFVTAVKAIVWVWVLIVFWSAIALRQHYTIDLIAGGVLAIIVWRVIEIRSTRRSGVLN